MRCHKWKRYKTILEKMGILKKMCLPARKERTAVSKRTAKKWTTHDVNLLIYELEKRHCLWDVFKKEYRSRERREAACAELQEILNFSKNEIIKSKTAGLRTQPGVKLQKPTKYNSQTH